MKIISPSPLYLARRQLEVYWRKCKAVSGGTDINANNEIVNLQNFLEGFFNILDPTKVVEIFTFRKNQNTGTGATLYGILGKSSGMLEGTAAWRADNAGVNLPTEAAAISVPFTSLISLQPFPPATVPISIIVVLRVNANDSHCRYGHTTGDKSGYFAHHNFWSSGPPARGFGALKNEGAGVVVPCGGPQNGPCDNFIPLDGKYHYVQMSITQSNVPGGDPAGTISLDGGKEFTAITSTFAWSASNFSFAPRFHLAKSVPPVGSVLNDDLTFLAFVGQDLAGKMASIKDLLAGTICHDLQ